MTNKPTAIEMAKKFLSIRAKSKVSLSLADIEELSKMNLGGAHTIIAQALLDCEARCEALEDALEKCEIFIWNDFDLDDEDVIELQTARDATTQVLDSNPAPPALDKDARIAELTRALSSTDAVLWQLVFDLTLQSAHFPSAPRYIDGDKLQESTFLAINDHLRKTLEILCKKGNEQLEVNRTALAPRSADGKGE